MSFFLRTNIFPTLQQITAVPQIVVIDQTGPAVVLGTKQGAACLVGEFVAGTFVPTEVDSSGDVQAQYTADGKVWPYFAQNAAGIQNGNQAGAVGATYNGNGILALLGKTFQRLILTRVDHEAVTTDGGTTKAVLAVTVTVDTTDQDGSSNTNKDLVIPAGARMGSANTFAGSTRVFAVSGNITIPKGTALTANAVTVNVACFPVVVVEPVVATASSAIAFVLDPIISNAAAGTTITAVTNASILWPSGTGTTLSARIASQYPAAITKTLPVSSPSSDIVSIWAARRLSTIRQAIHTNAFDSSNVGRGRIGLVAADPAASASSADAGAAKTAAIGLAIAEGYGSTELDPGDRVIICFPASKVLVPDFGNIKVTVNSDGWMATTLANFAEEVNPGAANPYIQSIVELEDAFVANPLNKIDYQNLIAGGVCALYHDSTQGWQFMQGVTAANPALFPTRTPIKRRRMADLIEDTLAQIASAYIKLPATTERIDAFVSECDAFLATLKSTDLPAFQRIVDYSLDEKSGNTKDNQALGIFVLKVFVRTLPSLDFPVFIAKIGETVTIPVTTQAAA